MMTIIINIFIIITIFIKVTEILVLFVITTIVIITIIMIIIICCKFLFALLYFNIPFFPLLARTDIAEQVEIAAEEGVDQVVYVIYVYFNYHLLYALLCFA